jgi:predicted RND superfamily exporter protein
MLRLLLRVGALLALWLYFAALFVAGAINIIAMGLWPITGLAVVLFVTLVVIQILITWLSWSQDCGGQSYDPLVRSPHRDNRVRD